jgi:DMSO/TMAO reductase YedYZ molybdopterin-dependent catalytic subunit
MSGRDSAGNTSRRPQLPPGQHARADFPRFGTHLYLRAPDLPVDPVIEVAGVVQEVVFVPADALTRLPRRAQTSALHCVSGWSAINLRWEGVPFTDFYVEFIEPVLDCEATHLILEGSDGYRVVERLADALARDVLIADRLNGKPLSSDHGAPLRFVSPSQYGYVSVKHLARIEVHAREPRMNFSWVHWMGAAIMRPPFFWRHPRGRVWNEERNRYLPAWLLRPIYAPLRLPIRILSRCGGEGRRRGRGPRS